MLNAKWKNNNLQIHNFEMTQKHFRIKKANVKTQQLQHNKQTKHLKRQQADGTIKLEENRNAYTDKAIIDFSQVIIAIEHAK